MTFETLSSQDMLFSCARGGILASSLFGVTYPWDYMRTQLQQSNGAFKDLRVHWKNYGIRGFFHGAYPTFVRTFLKEAGHRNVIRDIGGEYFRTLFPGSLLYSLMATSTALAIADTIILNPVEVAKNLSIASPGIFSQKKSESYAAYVNFCFKQIGGIRGCYQGVTITLLRNKVSQFSFLFFSQFGRELYLKKKYPNKSMGSTLTMKEAVAIGAASGVANWVATTPFDALKAKVQATPHAQPIKIHTLLTTQRLSSFYFANGGFCSFAYYVLYAALTTLAMEIGRQQLPETVSRAPRL